MSKEILRPCPFCGGKIDFEGAIVTERMATPASAICRICRFRYVTDLILGNTGKYSPSGFDIESMRKSDEYLLQSVNRRPIEDALKARIAELEKQIDDLRGELAQSDTVSHLTRIAELVKALNDVSDAIDIQCPTCIYSCMPYPDCLNNGCEIYVALDIVNEATVERITGGES